MIPRIVDVAQENKFISKSLGFLRISDKNGKDEVAIDDIAVLMLSGYAQQSQRRLWLRLRKRERLQFSAEQNVLPLPM